MTVTAQIGKGPSDLIIKHMRINTTLAHFRPPLCLTPERSKMDNKCSSSDDSNVLPSSERKRRILIVSDSRGKQLKPYINPPQGCQIEFAIKEGATLNEAKNITWEKLNNTRYVCSYLMVGICSITMKDAGLIYLPFDTKEEIVDATTREIKTTLAELDGLFTTPIVMCAFPGVDLIRANNKNAKGHHPQQDFLNEAIIEVNDYIADHNLSRGFSTPMLSAAIHRCHGRKKDGAKKYRHHYCRLQDGIHPTAPTLKYWGKRFEEDFEQFVFTFDQL